MGYKDGDELWTASGHCVGKFHGDDIHDTQGDYLGEQRGDRLVTQTTVVKPTVAVMAVRALRSMSSAQADKSGKSMLAGYEDFPDPDDLD